MEDLTKLNFFTDENLSDDPYPWIEKMRQKGNVVREPIHGAYVVTGLPEAAEIYARPEDFSNVACVGGPMMPMPFTPEGDDIGAQIEQHRGGFLFSDHFITFDGADHKAHRSIMTKLLTFKRLKSNEQFMQRYAAELIDKFRNDGRCELMAQYAQPLSTLVITDLLGIPEDERPALVARILPAPGTIGNDAERSADPFALFESAFTEYLEDRRVNPRDDMITDLANSRLPDGSDPGLPALVRIASFLFVAGQDTSAKLLASCVRFIAEDTRLQAELRADRSRIGVFIEEVLRLESPTKSDFRLVRRTSTIGGVEIKAGSMVMLQLAGANRDPRLFECPASLDIHRRNVRDHIAFGKGPHACPGAPLARLEAKAGIERLFDNFEHIALDPAVHGTEPPARLDYLRSFILRGLNELHLVLS